ncbi:MAG TPA: hypothetical protein PKD19_01210 [Candidatus Saccharibacteria bacterium]|nr:hypothetical protein [Candidatus Saccharibacteria bacterium]HMR37984.1 hypothetical protein [Candidatus Saccharibacteria bacterium]
MHKHPSISPDILSSRPSNPADVGGTAVIAAMVECKLSKTPEANVEDLESERKKNTTENLRILQKRFGERFVKGTLMEGGGYTGGAARELLAGFMDQAGFADELKRIIPNKYGALQLLKDNHAYIQATLEKHYKDGPTYERQPVKDPYELARSVGYELTGPFEFTSEFVPYKKQDYRPGEDICTFNNPVGRLEEYHILWLRHAEVAKTLPADQLSADNLSDEWKTYLKTIGRYDESSDSYDIAGLRPTRDDPYGTSSMSVQISRKGAHVSVKNRYNHTVVNPDNTLDSDLDNVAYGLKRAVYARVGREDLMSRTSVALAESYIADNENGIHAYKYEEDNVYYGDYEYIENGVVTTIDRGRYDMVSPQIYVPKSGKGDEIRLGQRAAGITEFAANPDIRYLHENSTKGNKEDPLVELRKAYAERDHTELVQMLSEELKAQNWAAYDTYQNTAVKLRGNAEVITDAAFAGLLERKMAEWRQNGVTDYLVKELIEKGSRPNLVAVPNVAADYKQLKALAVGFGESQPYPTYTEDAFLSKFTSEELSGNKGDEPVRLMIIPSGYNLQYGTVEQQRAELKRKQDNTPELGFKSISTLENIVYFKTLRARGIAMQGNAIGSMTFSRDIGVKERSGAFGGLCVPCSSVNAVGRAIMAGYLVGSEYDGRLSLGSNL